MSIGPAHPEVLSQALPDYEFGEELGSGAFGVVWAARHRQLGRSVAIKLLTAPAGEADLHARFVSEARLLATLDHPNVVPLYDFVQVGGMCLLVMERLHGGTVRDRQPALTAPAACVVAVATCMGLHHAHARGVLHRDVKPANIMLSASGVVKVTDFGIATLLGGAATGRARTGAIAGTPDYMAPEQVASLPLSPATDVYAVGLVLYELLAGAKPFAGSDLLAVMYQRVHGDPVPLLERAPSTPAPRAAVIARALRRDPAARYASAHDLAVAISEAATEHWGAGWQHDTGVTLGISVPVASTQVSGVRAGAGRPRDDGLIERDYERSAIEEALERARGGSGAMVVLEGMPGLGKTRLLAGVVEGASARGHVVLRASGAQAETAFALGVVHQLLDPVLRSIDPVQRRRLRQGAPGAGLDALAAPMAAVWPAAGSDDVTGAIFSLIVELARETPLAVIVDDAQWADEASLRVLAYLGDRMLAVAASVILATRVAPAQPASPLAAVLGVPTLCRLRLRPLTRAGTQELVRELVGADVHANVAEICHDATLGNPFLVAELVRAARAGGGAIDGAAFDRVIARPPRALIGSLLQRLGSIDDAALEVVEATAVLGDHAPVRHGAALTGLTGAAVLRAAQALADAGILHYDEQQLAFVQPLMRAAVCASLPPEARGEAHRRAAWILHGEVAEAEQVAAHMLAAAPAGDATLADVLVAAAVHADERGAPETAAAYLVRALAEPPAGERLGEVRLALGMAELASCRPGPAAEHLHTALIGDLPVELRARAAIGLAHALCMSSDLDGALAVLDEHKRGLDAQLALRLDVEQATVGAFVAKHAPDALQRMRGYRELAGSSATERQALALAALGMSLDPAASAGDAAAAVLRALGDGRPLAEQDYGARAHALATFVLIMAERVDAADEEVRRLVVDASARGARRALAGASLLSAFVSSARGELGTSLTHAATALERVLELAPGPLRGRWVGGAIQLLVDGFLARGDLSAARIAVERAEAEGSVSSLELAPVRYARAALRLADGDEEGALWDYLACGEMYRAAGHEDRVVPWRGGAAQACARLGRNEKAIGLADEQLAVARVWGAPVANARALGVRALVGPWAESVPLLTEAARLLDGSHARLERARVLADLGVALVRDQRQAGANRALERALALAGQCGATVLEKRCRRELAY